MCFIQHLQADRCTINPMLGVLFHSIFMLVCTYIMIQLVIGIVLDGIQMQTVMEEMVIGEVSKEECVFSTAVLLLCQTHGQVVGPPKEHVKP